MEKSGWGQKFPTATVVTQTTQCEHTQHKHFIKIVFHIMLFKSHPQQPPPPPPPDGLPGAAD